MAHIGLGDLPVSAQDTRQNSLTASMKKFDHPSGMMHDWYAHAHCAGNDGGLTELSYPGYTPSPLAPRARPVRGPPQPPGTPLWTR